MLGSYISLGLATVAEIFTITRYDWLRVHLLIRLRITESDLVRMILRRCCSIAYCVLLFLLCVALLPEVTTVKESYKL